MREKILDKIDQIKIDLDNPPIDNLHALDYLKDEIVFLASQIKETEKIFLEKKIRPVLEHEREIFPGQEFIEEEKLVGLDFTGKYNYMMCIFHWFTISIVNYIRTIALVDYLQKNNLKLKDIKDYHKKVISHYCSNYVEKIIPEIKKTRDKIAAHFSATDPYFNDNSTDLELSLISTLSIYEGLFEINGINFARDGVSNTPIPSWSITKEFEKLRLRFDF